MKYLILLLLLAGCQAHIEVRLTGQGVIEHTITVDSVRRTMVAVDGGQVTIITGQVLIDDETVQALGREPAKIITVPEL